STRDDDPFVEVGSPLPGVSLRIVDAQNSIVDEGTVGSLQITGVPVTSGYYKNPELNREGFTGEGGFKTGELGFIRQCRVSVTGRERDVVIINGANYYSHEIEAVVEEVAGVEVSYTAACAVRGPGVGTDQLAIFFHPTSSDETHLVELVREVRIR